MAKWFGTQEEDDPGKAVEAKFASLETQLKASADSSAATAKSVADFIAAQNAKDQAAEAARQKAEAAAKKPVVIAKTAEEQAEEFFADPAAFINRTAAPTTKVAIMAAAKQIRDEVLGGMEYYHGDFKKKVDALIESTNDITQTSNTGYIMNCYRCIKADHMDDIIAGKLKKSAAMHSFADAGTSGERNVDPNAKPTIEFRDNKSAYAAKMMGLTDEDFIGAAKDQAIHGLEVVA